MKSVDARGQICPKPVLMARKALDEIEAGVVRVLVDNSGARDNLLLMAENAGYAVEEAPCGTCFAVTITKGAITVDPGAGDDAQPGAPADGSGPLVVVIGTDRLGQGDEELGRVLMRSFLYTLAEGPAPATVIFLNSGVRLSTEGSPVLENLNALEAKGTEILSCGTCLNFYQLHEKLAVGKVTNMYTILEKLAAAGKTISW